MAPRFENRLDAGRQLAAEVLRHRPQQAVVLALPRGGVPVAVEVARALRAPLDLLLVRKIGAPSQPELAIAAVAEGLTIAAPVIVVDDLTRNLSSSQQVDIQASAHHELQEITRRRQLYLKGRPPLPVQGHTAIVVDDGIATGTTMRAAIAALRQREPARIVIAVPVASGREALQLASEVDDMICLMTPADFQAVGQFYRHFEQVSDAEVIALMQPSG